MASPPPSADPGHGRKRPAKYLHHIAKRKKDWELRPGLQGFLITCDGGRERQSCREAIALLERFYEKVANDRTSSANSVVHGNQSTNSSTEPGFEISKQSEGKSLDADRDDRSSTPSQSDIKENDSVKNGSNPTEAARDGKENVSRADESRAVSKGGGIDCLLEDELSELRDRNKARFAGLETGCSGIVFIRMLKEGADTNVVASGPNAVVEAIMQEAVNFGKPLTRSCLRFLPVEITCYASADEVKKVVQPFLSQHFPLGQGIPALKFAVVYEARANTSLERMEIINAVAKLVEQPHSVDLKNPDKTIIVQVVKTICAVGVVKSYKEFAKYNLRQLTSVKQQA